jgi:tetratricopeptide (TPR) repeat protein
MLTSSKARTTTGRNIMEHPLNVENNIEPVLASRLLTIVSDSFISGIVLATACIFNAWGMENIPALQKTAPKSQDLSHKRAKKIRPVAPRHHPSVKPVPIPAVDTSPSAVTKMESAVNPIPSIHIEHDHESDTVEPILLAAWQAYHNGDFEAASQLYSEMLRKNVQGHNAPNRDALLGMAAIAQQRSQDSIAAQYYSQLLDLDPRDPDAHAGMSSLLGAFGAANMESSLKFLLVQHPEAAVLHFALGNLYAQQSRWGDAQQAYFGACALESDNARFAFNLAVSLDHLGQGKLAAQYYRRALQLDSVGNIGFDRAQTQLRLDELTH